MIWKFSNAAEIFEADEIYQTLSETVVDLDSKFETEANKTSKYNSLHDLSMFYKQELFKRTRTLNLEIILAPNFLLTYSPKKTCFRSRTMSRNSTDYSFVSHPKSISFYIKKKKIKLKALVLTVNIICNCILGWSMRSHIDGNMQLAFLHSMKISTSRSIIELSKNASYAEGIAKEGESLTAKFFFLYLSTPLVAASTTNQPLLLPFLAWLFPGICLDLYEI